MDLMTNGFDCLLSTDLARFAFWAVDALPAIRLAFGATDSARPATAEASRREAYLDEVRARRQAAIQYVQVLAVASLLRFCFLFRD
jgi:hypothetical protein